MDSMEMRVARLERAQGSTRAWLIGATCGLAGFTLAHLKPTPPILAEARAGGVAAYGTGGTPAPKLVFTSSEDGTRLFVWKVGDEGWAAGRAYDVTSK